MNTKSDHYDVIVIGSGFGGSVAALRATEKGYKVGVLPRVGRDHGLGGPIGQGARTNSEKSPGRRCKCDGRMRRALHPAGMTGKAAAPPQTCWHICTSGSFGSKTFC
jgi:choline dehydrogenase-like flavoprotein